jgi:hypothetical protein
VKLLVHTAAVGAILGKAGALIKQLQTDTSCRLQISQEVLGVSSEKSVAFTGSPQAIYDAFSRALNQLRENPLRSSVRVIPYVPTPQGGAPSGLPQFGGGLGLQSQQQQQRTTLSSSGIPTITPSYAQSSLSIGGGGGQQQQSVQQKIAIPTICAGSVIGKGGSVIRDIKMQSGCNISIADPEPNNPTERVVTLSGSHLSIQSAIMYIRHIVENFQPPQQQQQQQQQQHAYGGGY